MVNKPTSDMSLTANGLRDWLIQRFSAIILAIYFLVIVIFLLTHSPINFITLKSLFTHLWMQVFSLIMLLCLIFHAWVGIWTVITDYIKPIVLRIFIQMIIILSLFIYFFWGIEVLWRLI